jgi:carboxylesterase type B
MTDSPSHRVNFTNMGTSQDGTILFPHPQLGLLKGLVPLSGVHQFRSLPYARIPHRFSDPEVLTSLPSREVFDATKFGPVAPQPADAEEQEFVTPKERIPHQDLEQDEFRCANLNVTVPMGKETRSGGLPVMVWFHGGSFMLGAASWPQYGMAQRGKVS